MTVVYIDSLFLLNLLLDYLLLRVTARICGQYVPMSRLALGALFGALYAVCAFLPGCGFLTHPLIKIMAGILLALIAFGGRRRLLRLTGVFFICACALGGGVLMISLLGNSGLTYSNGIPATSLDVKVLLLSAAGIYFVLTICMRCLGRYSKLSREVVPVTLVLEGRSVKVDALVDTGNTLCDPLSDARVMVAEWEAVQPLFSGKFSLEERALKEPTVCAGRLSMLLGEGRVRLLPYRAVGVEAGMLLAIRVDKALIGGEKEERLLVALCPGKLAANGNYTALIGAEA